METWDAILKLRDDGVVKSVGVSNFGVPHLKLLAEHKRPLPQVRRSCFKFQVGCLRCLLQFVLDVYCDAPHMRISDDGRSWIDETERCDGHG